MRATERYDFETKQWVKIEDAPAAELHYVQDDIKEFRNTDGTMISGRAQWREHLERTGTIELGHSDIASAKEKWDKRRADFKEKSKQTGQYVAQATTEIRPRGERTRLNAEVMNRLEGRPTPPRKQLLKLILETNRRYGRN